MPQSIKVFLVLLLGLMYSYGSYELTTYMSSLPIKYKIAHYYPGSMPILITLYGVISALIVAIIPAIIIARVNPEKRITLSVISTIPLMVILLQNAYQSFSFHAKLPAHLVGNSNFTIYAASITLNLCALPILVLLCSKYITHSQNTITLRQPLSAAGIIARTISILIFLPSSAGLLWLGSTRTELKYAVIPGLILIGTALTTQVVRDKITWLINTIIGVLIFAFLFLFFWLAGSIAGYR